VVLFDLDGFKAYNDAFGHPAGDALLARLSGRLGYAVAPHRAYRVGGDEFCVLIAADRVSSETVVEAGSQALVEHGEAFSITASHGAVSMPEEARSSELALQLADRRMYAHKDRRLNSPSEQTRAALQALLDERSPAASAHHRELADLAYLLAARQGLGQPDLDHVVRAAELHDVGRVALPAGLAAAGDDDPLVAQQNLIAERILTAAPALVPVARIVRSLHERYDGGGHPDGLAGQDIPVAARILGAVQAFCDRLGPERKPAPGALEWLTAQGGGRLDPFVADTLRELARELRLTELELEARRALLAERAAARRAGLRPEGPALGIGRA
jgi:diguanylate cyclase (GGDEF)-like protein